MADSFNNTNNDKQAGNEEFFDAVRRHICHILGFDFGLIDILREHKFENILSFIAEDKDESWKAEIEKFHDEHQQPMPVAHTLLAQKAKQTRRPVVTKVWRDGEPSTSFVYVIVPITNAPDGAISGKVIGLVRIVSLDETKEISHEDLARLKSLGQNIAPKLLEYASKLQEIPCDDHGQKHFDAEHIVVGHTNRLLRRRLSRILGESYHVLEAENGPKLLSFFDNGPVDLVIADSALTTESGKPLCHELKISPRYNGVPVIVITPDDRADERLKNLEQGVEECLLESSLDAEVLARTRALLRHHQFDRDRNVQLKLLEDYAKRLEQEHKELSRSRQVSEEGKEELNKKSLELELRKQEIEVRNNQDRLLHRISTIIRRSFDTKENVLAALDNLAGYFNLGCCFVVLPSEDEPGDTLRLEYMSDESFEVVGKDIDVALLESYKRHIRSDRSLFDHDGAIFVNDVNRDRRAELFIQEALHEYPIGSFCYVPVTAQGELLGLLGFHKTESHYTWTDDNKNFLKRVSDQIAMGVTNARLYACVQRQASIDGLTGLFNHRTIKEKLLEQLRSAERYQRRLSVVMVDVDHFKSVNDTHGHPGGDKVLKAVAELLQSGCRDVDIPGRYGGEEFILILPEVNREGAVVFAERIRRRLASLSIEHEGVKIHVTASFGVASFPDDAEDEEVLLDLADRALYMSKRMGRNQVHTATDLEFTPYIKTEESLESDSDSEEVSADADTASGVEHSGVKSPDDNAAMGRIYDIDRSKASGHSLPGSDDIPAAPSHSQAVDTDGQDVVRLVRELASQLYAKSEYNKVHHIETARFAEMLANMLGLSRVHVEQIRVASLLHDVGFLSIPQEVLTKPGAVSADEMDLIKQHPGLGAELLRPVPALKEICEILENHHEHWDGTGYPQGLKGEQIPLPARIVSIVDAYHAMICDRPWRKAMSKEEAKKTLQSGAGTQWDPFLVNVFIAMIDNLDKG